MSPSRPRTADDRDLAVERHELLVEQRRIAERGPGRVEIRRLAQDDWPLPS